MAGSVETTEDGALGMSTTSMGALEVLPQEILDMIFGMLPIADSLCLLGSCRRLYADNYQSVIQAFIRRNPQDRDYMAYWAAWNWVPKILHEAFEAGLDVNSLIPDFDDQWQCLDPRACGRPRFCTTLLHICLAAGDDETSRWLLEEKGADPTVKFDGSPVCGTSIATAIQYGSRLAAHLATFWESEPFNHYSALDSAITSGNVDMVRYLHGRGANLNERDPFYGSPLTVAAQSGVYGVAALLLELGAEIDTAVLRLHIYNRSPRYQHVNALIAAAIAMDEEMMRLFISHGANCNTIMDGDVQPLTPLGLAVTENRTNVAALLLQHGADPNLVVGAPAMSWTPYALALRQIAYNTTRERRADMLHLLVAHGADPNICQWNHEPAVQMVVMIGLRTEVDRRLTHHILDHGVDVEAVSPRTGRPLQSSKIQDTAQYSIQWTAMHCCLTYEDGICRVFVEGNVLKESMVGMLLDRGADPLGGYHGRLDDDDEVMQKTPMGQCLRRWENHFRDPRQTVGSTLDEHATDALLSFISHPRGAQSTATFNTQTMAQLLAVVALMPAYHGYWFAWSRTAKMQRFAELTCVGERRSAKGKDAWLVTLLQSPGYWSFCDLGSHNEEVRNILVEAAENLPSELWEEVRPSVPTAAAKRGV